MKPVRFRDANAAIGGKNIGVLSAYTNGEFFITRWRPSLRERLSMLFFGSVWVYLAGEKYKPLAITGERRAHFVLPLLELHQVEVALGTPDDSAIDAAKSFTHKRLKPDTIPPSERKAQESLEQLLHQVDTLFTSAFAPSDLPASYNYTLDRFPQGWQFMVVNSWHKWSDAKLIYRFGVYESPTAAVQEFLDYVASNHIDVQSLTEFAEEKAQGDYCDWTTEIPKEEGYYWAINNGKWIVLVRKNRTSELIALIPGDSFIYELESFEAWCGPIQEVPDGNRFQLVCQHLSVR